MKSNVLNELLDENLVARINAYLDQRDDNEKVTLNARVTINVPVRLPVYKNGDYSGSNIWEDCLDCATEYLEGGASVRNITSAILIHTIETETREPEEPDDLASISDTMAHFNIDDAEWESLLPRTMLRLRRYVFTKL
jgi:hypothetical protein